MGTQDTTIRSTLADPRTRARLLRVAGRVAGTYVDAEDAAHDAVVLAISHANRFRSDAQVSTWMHRIAVNAALMARRKRQRSDKWVNRAAEEAVVAAPAAGARTQHAPSAEALLTDLRDRQRLAEAVAQLPDSYRAVIEECVYAEKTPEQAAVSLGLTAGAVRTRLGRARAHLRQLLTSDVDTRDTVAWAQAA